MICKPLKSSVFESATLDGQRILVRFRNGAVYAYTRPEDSPPLDLRQLYNDFVNAESNGRFFQANIRRRLTGRKLEPEEIPQ